jgi:hypothetical protein
LETITKKSVLIEFKGKKHVLPADVTLGKFLTTLGLSEETPVRMTVTKEGFLLEPCMMENP